jgi:hypothetical protein
MSERSFTAQDVKELVDERTKSDDPIRIVELSESSGIPMSSAFAIIAARHLKTKNRHKIKKEGKTFWVKKEAEECPEAADTTTPIRSISQLPTQMPTETGGIESLEIDPREMAERSAHLVLKMATDALTLMSRTGGVAAHGAKEIQILQRMAGDAAREAIDKSNQHGESLSMMSKAELREELERKLKELDDEED